MVSHGFMRLAPALVLVAGLATTANAQNAPAPAAPKIDLKLFEKGEVDRSKGCSFVLWQSDRDPDKDRYAYVFAETLGRNQVRENARIKVGNDVLTFKRVAVGGTKEFGYKTFPYALYKADKDASYLVFDLKLEDSPGEVMDVEGGTMTVVRPGLPPFPVTVKGNAGCNTPAAPPPPAPKRTEAPAPAAQKMGGTPALFEKYNVPGNRIPRGMVALAEQKMSCMGSVMRRGAVGYSLSEESALWEIPCDSFVYQGHSVFAIVYTPDPAKQFEFVMFDAPKGKIRSTDANQLMTPTWDIKNRIVTGVSLGRAQGDCGTLERHKLGEDGQFTLIEYREKENCDGKATRPDTWPLVFKR
jgi:hypothetical protein